MYYFVTYEHKEEGSDEWERHNIVIDRHPVYWLTDKTWVGDYSYRILFFHEIDQYQYNNGKQSLS